MGMSIVMGVPPNGGFLLENPIKMDDLGAPPFMESLKYILLYGKLVVWKKINPAESIALLLHYFLHHFLQAGQ